MHYAHVASSSCFFKERAFGMHLK